MFSRSDVVDHYKRKFYQRFIDPDLTVESISLSRSSQTSRPSTSATTSSTTQQARPRSTGGTSTQANCNVGSLLWDQQTIQFSVNAWLPCYLYHVNLWSILPDSRGITSPTLLYIGNISRDLVCGWIQMLLL